ncbi:MAG: hypothetical protein EGQ81_01265 [Akkermansia sp.]|nr:hypothetical protein [Akkermansia sp.]
MLPLFPLPFSLVFPQEKLFWNRPLPPFHEPACFNLIPTWSPRNFLLLFWSILPMAIYYWLRSRNKEKPVTGTEYLVTIPLFLLFGWFTLFCTWLIHLARNLPAGR